MPNGINLTQTQIALWVTVAAQLAVILLAIGLLTVLVANRKMLFLPTATILFATAFIIFSRTVAAEIDSDTLVIALIPLVIVSSWGRDRFKNSR